MNSFDTQIKQSIETILTKGKVKSDRTGTGTVSYPGIFIRHDMTDGFPLSTLRKMPFKSAAVELEGFIGGITSKKWYEERGCYFWSSWANPKKAPYGTDEVSKDRMRVEDDLGLIYSSQMRNFLDPVATNKNASYGVDQLKYLVNLLRSNPNDRRGVVSYWNPLALDYQALPPCHISFIVNIVDGYLNLSFTQRSCDFLIGNNLSSYGLMLHLLAKELNVKEGILSAMYHDTHIYDNQIDAAKEILNRDFFELPSVQTEKFTSIFDWTHKDTKILNYKSGEKVNIPIAV